MVARDPSAAWSRFLAAEAAGRADEAEAALVDWFAATPRRAPAPGFAGRVMARVVARRSLFARRPVRFGVAAALALAALSAALVAPMALPVVGLVSVGDLIRFGGGAFARLAIAVASGLSGWEMLAEIVGAVGRALVAPAALPYVVAPFAVAALALRGLLHLASHPRRSNHAVLR